MGYAPGDYSARGNQWTRQLRWTCIARRQVARLGVRPYSDQPMVARVPLVLYVDDEPNNLELLKLQFENTFRLSVAGNAGEALTILDREEVCVLLTDERMPGMSGIDLLASAVTKWPDTRRIIVSAYSDAPRLLQAINRGHAHDYVLKPWNQQELGACIERNLEIGERRRKLTAQAQTAALLERDAAERCDVRHVVGADGGLKATLAVAHRAAQTEATVLLVGETGTGKELVARFIHEASARAGAPCVRVTCAGLGERDLERALSGHGGTVFLDEPADLTQALQATLLHLLKERRVERLVGSTRRDLPALVRAGQFREDLYYLFEVPIPIPPLRERAEDIPALLDHAVRKHGPPRSIAGEALRGLCEYHWPGNVRELLNRVQGALINSPEGELTAEDFTFTIDFPADSIREDAREAEKETLRRALVSHGGNCSRAARALKQARTTFLYRAKKHGLIP